MDVVAGAQRVWDVGAREAEITGVHTPELKCRRR